MPCSSEFGWWSASYNCYLSAIGPTSDNPAEFLYRCHPGTAGWTQPDDQPLVRLPAGADGPDPETLAWDAVDTMQLQGPTIGTAPPPGTTALVNAPVWLWAADPQPTTWGPISASAAAGAVSVTATAKAESVDWNTGDGTHVTCGQGTPYSEGATSSCSHTYRTPGARTLTATTTWQVQWQSNSGATGSFTVTTASSASIEIREARAVLTFRD